jgi:primosomal protein N' (replication factor Y)
VFWGDGGHIDVKMTENQARIVQILPATAVDKAFDYAIPHGMPCDMGTVVTIPLMGRKIQGVVWSENPPETPHAKIKEIISVISVPPLTKAHRTFIEKMAHYNFADKGAVLKLGFSIDFIERKRAPKKPILFRTPKPDHLKRALNDDQFAAAKLLSLHVQQGGYKPFLLDGVTGSGKTEVYFEAIATAIKEGQQALILLPEIALSNAFMKRFEERFGVKPYLWHSSITPAQRKQLWMGVAKGEVRVVIGARSSLFLPFQSLGVIVVDEEHDASYKQEEGVIYHARDMAVLRAHAEQIPIILASATPSLETMHNVWTGKYQHILLPTRYHDVTLPSIDIIDLKRDKPARNKFLAPRVIDMLKDVLSRSEQSLLFLNRRGYAPLTICRTCGHRVECPRCTAWLVEHRAQKKLSCHHCGYESALPKKCPSCDAEDSLTACGPGIERIAEEVHEAIPEARTLLLASDVTDTPAKIETALNQIAKGEVDIIIGTQIVAKGHHMPQLTHVTVVDGDLGLAGSDLRASERTFQLLHQVSGRAGREAKSGNVFIQTFNPDHAVMKLLKDNNRADFMLMESEQRERANMPPYGRLAGVIITGVKEHIVKDTAMQLVKQIPNVDGVKVLGPAPAPMYRIRGKYRYRLLVQADKKLDLSKYMQSWIGEFKAPSSIKITVDIDPQSFN